MKGLFLTHIISGVVAFILTYFLVAIITKVASRFGILDVPDGKIKCHKKPIPYLGGLAIYLGFLITIILFYSFNGKLLFLLSGASILLLTGIIDDLKVLKPGQKFLGQIIAVTCFLIGGFLLKTTFLSSWGNLFLSGFWMLSIINAFNLVDVMDGLSSVIALVGTSAFFIIALLSGKFMVSLLLIIFFFSVLAFFLHNKPPAKIYLGDAGSLFIGGFLSTIPLLIPWSDTVVDVHYAPAIIFAVPLIEVFWLIVIRTHLGIPFYKGSPHHFSIYLQNKGWSKRFVLIYVVIMSCLVALFGILHYVGILTLGMTSICCVVFFVLWCFIVFTRFLRYLPN